MSRVRSTRRFLVTKCPFLSVVDVSRLADFSQEKSATKARLKQEERKLKSPETITVNGSFPFVRKELSSAQLRADFSDRTRASLADRCFLPRNCTYG